MPRLERIEVFPRAAPPEAEGHVARDRAGSLLRRHDRGRDALGEVRVERGAGRGCGRGRRGHGGGHGEAAVTVELRHARSRRSPSRRRSRTRSIRQTFGDAPRNNFIDDLVLKKLELLRLPPSGQCTDAEFVRRAYLDACGILPPAAEAEKFLADTDPKKRAKLIDRLLERPEFVDYWAYKWSDLLLVSSRKLPQPAMWAFYRKVRQSVADNEPWDRFARDILTASGSTLTNGGGNYFVLHKDVSDLAEATAVTFLGMSIGCARATITRWRSGRRTSTGRWPTCSAASG